MSPWSPASLLKAYVPEMHTALAADGRPGWKVTDQLAFNLLLDRNIIPIHVRSGTCRRGSPRRPVGVQTAHLAELQLVSRAHQRSRCHQPCHGIVDNCCNCQTDCFVEQAPKEDPRVIWTYGDKLRLKPLPVLVAANGHVYFYQHLPEKCGLALGHRCMATVSICPPCSDSAVPLSVKILRRTKLCTAWVGSRTCTGCLRLRCRLCWCRASTMLRCARRRPR